MPVDTGYFKRRILDLPELLKQPVVERKLSHIGHAVWTRIHQLLEGGAQSASQDFLDGALDALCQV